MKKQTSKKIVKRRHEFFVWIARHLVYPLIKLKTGYRGKTKKIKKETPYLLVSNHVTAFDPILVTGTLGQQIYYVASELIFSKGFISRALEFIFSPIPKAKSQVDLGAVKNVMKVIKEGGSVGIFVEGNSTMNGTISNVPATIGKLVLNLKVPLVIFNFKGGYLSNPRWSKEKRKGRFVGFVKEIYEYEEYKHLSADEINELIIKGIHVNAYQDGLDSDYQGKHNAEGLERLLFTCPSCHEPNTISTKKEMYLCHACGFSMKYDEYGYCHSTVFDESKNTIELDAINKLNYQTYIMNHPDYFFSVSGQWFEIFQKRRKHIGKVHVTFSQRGISVCDGKKKIEIIFYPLDKLDTIAMQQKEMVIIYPKEETTKALLLPKDAFASAYQFVITYQIFKYIEKNKNSKEPFPPLKAEEMGL